MRASVINVTVRLPRTPGRELPTFFGLVCAILWFGMWLSWWIVVGLLYGLISLIGWVITQLNEIQASRRSIVYEERTREMRSGQETTYPGTSLR